MPVKPPLTASPAADALILSVTRLNREARQLLETGLQGFWVAGEISNLAKPGSGHIYFTLKDEDAQVRCAMFRNSQRQLRFKPADGTQVVLRGTVSIYEARGSYQIIVEQMEEAGEALLRRQFEELKPRLDAEGLFATERKRALPALPRRIGVVTSPTGAAIRDILQILRRRYPIAEIIIYPTRVQGDGAREEIAAAIRVAGQRAECDVLIVGRGGGSLEDLWCFNEEIVAREIFACPVPVISAVGHEVDITIADLVADLRAPTPSGAAELVVPDRAALLATLQESDRRSGSALRRALRGALQLQQQLEGRLRRAHPGAILRQWQQRTDELARQLIMHTRRRLTATTQLKTALTARMHQAVPLLRAQGLAEHNSRLRRQLERAVQTTLQGSRARLAAAAGELNAVSPLATLERGYAIVMNPADGSVISDATTLKPGDDIEAQLANGRVNATVKKISKS